MALANEPGAGAKASSIDIWTPGAPVGEAPLGGGGEKTTATGVGGGGLDSPRGD